MNDQPPKGNPPILLETDYSALPDSQISAPAAVEGGRLVVRGGGANTIGGHPFSEVAYRDVVLDASVGLVAGDEHDLAGVFLRQSAQRTYIAIALSPAGYVYVAKIDTAGAQPIAEGPLKPDILYNAGIGAWNRITVVAFGPAIVVVLNGSVLVHAAVDEKYAQGYAGLFLQQGATSAEAKAAARWVQVRAVLVDQK